MSFGADPAAAFPRRLGALLRGPSSGRRAGPPRNPSCPPQNPKLPRPPIQTGPAGGGTFPAAPVAAGRSAPGAALPRRRGELGQEPRDLLDGGTRGRGPLAWPSPCVDSQGEQSRSLFPTPGQTRSFSDLLAPGPVLRAPGIGCPRFLPWGGGHGVGEETGLSQADQIEKGPDSSGEGGIPEGKNKGLNLDKEGCEIPQLLVR